MEILVKIGSAYPSSDSRHELSWKDGQLIDHRPNGYYQSKYARLHHAVISLPNLKFFENRGSQLWKSKKPSVFLMKRYLCAKINGKYRWESGYKEIDSQRKRDHFLDFKKMVDEGWISQSQYDSLYNKKVEHYPIIFPEFTSFEDFAGIFYLNEDTTVRRSIQALDSPGSISSGTCSIGSGLDYDDLTAFEADLVDLTGNLTAEHNAEETSISSDVVFSISTGSYKLTITAQSGDEHSGGAYSDGARVQFGTYDSLKFDESGDGTLNSVEVSKLALDASGSGNEGVYFDDAGGGTLLLVNRMLVKTDSDTPAGLFVRYNTVGNIRLTNNVIYGGADEGISLNLDYNSGRTLEVYNNTSCKNKYGLGEQSGSPVGTAIAKNNLFQGNTTADWSDANGAFGTTAKNVTEDATSPDAGYGSLNCHDGNSCFEDYANDDYKLKSGGDELGTLDDGEDLSGTFTDDIIGNTRSTFYIGCSELIVAGGLSIPVAMHHLKQQRIS